MIKALIVDNQPEARELINTFLGSYPGIIVVGQADSVDKAILLTKINQPDLVLLDIQMPGKDGFQYLEELKEIGLYPGIIFVTAHEEFAIRALKNAAFDYLIKPVSKKELFSSIDRYVATFPQRKNYDLHDLEKIIDRVNPRRIKCNTRSGCFFVDPDEIVFVKADGNYSHIQLIDGKSEIITINIGSMEKKLDGVNFIRVCRSYILNMNYISRVNRKDSSCELKYNTNIFTIKIPAHRIRILEDYF
ncbi:MAG: LytTR family DNA-binding domain-containing protein [Bacteroidales bacterium]|nr:LytTR family DNA-binding domain-containing protein [Bacteroidales bacterium]